MYYVYEYPNGYGCVSTRRIDDEEHILRSECKDMRTAKETLKDIISTNYVNRKIKR